MGLAKANEPIQQYVHGFKTFAAPVALGLATFFVILSQVKINSTNAYSGSLSWSNFFSRLTHRHPGRVVYIFLNVGIALALMEGGVFGFLNTVLGFYSNVAIAWIGAVVADLVINKPLKLSPSYIEFKRAHLYNFNPVGFGSMLIASAVSIAAYFDAFGDYAKAYSPFIALFLAMVLSPVRVPHQGQVLHRPPRRPGGAAARRGRTPLGRHPQLHRLHNGLRAPRRGELPLPLRPDLLPVLQPGEGLPRLLQERSRRRGPGRPGDARRTLGGLILARVPTAAARVPRHGPQRHGWPPRPIGRITPMTSHFLVSRARHLADDLLAPHAEQVDQEGVPASHIEAIKRSGLLGVSAPVAYGGSAAPGAVARETAEILAGSCCSTWFVQTQHHTPVMTLAKSELPVREHLLGPLARGELMSGVAYAHLRAFPRIPVRVTRERGGWRFDGTVPWYTGWGLNDVMLLAGVTDADEALFAFTEAREQEGLRPSDPMRLAALTASRTVSLELGQACGCPRIRWRCACRTRSGPRPTDRNRRTRHRRSSASRRRPSHCWTRTRPARSARGSTTYASRRTSWPNTPYRMTAWRSGCRSGRRRTRSS